MSEFDDRDRARVHGEVDELLTARRAGRHVDGVRVEALTTVYAEIDRQHARGVLVHSLLLSHQERPT